jgi:hypothetical protein
MTLSKWAYSVVLSSAVLGSALVGACVWATAVQPAMAQEALTRVLTVTGQGRETIATTLTQVDLGVEAQGATAAEVQQEIARRSTAVVELLRSQNVEKLQTTGIQLNPQYKYDDGQPQLVGYSGSNTVSFRMPTERVGNLLDRAIEAGANRISGISFVAADAAIATARQTALRAATADAQQQANAVLGSLNLGPQEIIGIQINGANIPVPLPVGARLEAAAADFSTPVVGGEQTVEASVTLQIRY